jgi:hypothetical protein
MEFILQLLSDFLAPLEEQEVKQEMFKEEDSTEVGAVLVTEQTEEANIFNFVEFH